MDEVAHERVFAYPLVHREHWRGRRAVRVSARHFCKIAGIALQDIACMIARINHRFADAHRVYYDYSAVTQDVIVMW